MYPEYYYYMYALCLLLLTVSNIMPLLLMIHSTTCTVGLLRDTSTGTSSSSTGATTIRFIRSTITVRTWYYGTVNSSNSIQVPTVVLHLRTGFRVVA
eukprot:COSAG02_NODE_4687_length_5092_cov_2.075506_7_plen_97_part_00